MNTRKLSQCLYNGYSRIYAVLDGAAVPGLRTKLYEMHPQHICLYRGELEPDIAEVAPYLIRMVPDTNFSNWILTEGWGNHWGIFAQSQFSFEEMRKHFRLFLTVHDEAGTPLLFRYYDPRVFRAFLPTCNSGELQKFFGMVLNFAVEDENPQNLLNYYLPKGELKVIQSEIN
jgi:hypothetical protein